MVVESPAKARTINRYLGGGYLVKASMGHVRDLPEKAMGVDVKHGFKPSYEPLPGRRKVLSDLRKHAKAASEVFLATDLDREGEAIAWHLAESLGVSEDKIRRVIFNEITPAAIAEAFARPRRIDMNKVNAQQARRILDRIVGYEVSPLLWRKVARGLSAGRVQSVAVRLIVDREREIDAFTPEEYWRISGVFTTDCQNADSLARQWSDFHASKDEKGNAPTREAQQEFLGARSAFTAELLTFRGRRFQPTGAEEAIEAAKALGLETRELQRQEDPDAKGPARNRLTVIGRLRGDRPRFTVENLQQRESRTRPPAPFTTAALQQAAAVQIRFSAARTMRIAQQLYEGVDLPRQGHTGLITYMRTDSTHLAAEAVSAARRFIAGSFGPRYVPEKPNVYASAEGAQEAHEAIRPTDVTRRPENLTGALTDEQYKLYRLIWQRFVACQMPPAVWNVTEADVAAGLEGPGGQAVFRAMGRTLAFDGFMKVAGLPRGGDQVLPKLETNQSVACLELAPRQHFTQPPPRYTEASLVKALEADGIGRPSTYATIIQTIQDRGYVELADRTFRPTYLGTVVTDKLVKHLPDIFDVRFTAHMEDQLDKIEEAAKDWVSVLKEFYGPFSEHLRQAAENMVHAKAQTEPSDYVCNACGKPMVYRFTKSGRYLACTGYPKCRQTHPVDSKGKKIERQEVEASCPQCGRSPMILRRSRFGAFLGCANYPECKGTLPCDKEGKPLKLVKEQDIRVTCAECGAPMVVRWRGRRAFLACSRYPKCRATASLPEGLRLEPPPRPQPIPAGVECPKCGKPMVIRTGKRGKFAACSGFPRCRNAMSLEKLQELKANGGRSKTP